tara:strand:+ start:357 stop:647 length:291 start_codon:yes stop_codon:yes gene_type:complete
MLLLCVKIINQGTRRLKIIIESGAGLKPKNGGRRISKIGSEHEAIMDARDTYPVNTIAIIAMPKQNGKTEGNKAIIIPPSVPTPFPPLNPPKIVYV